MAFSSLGDPSVVSLLRHAVLKLTWSKNDEWIVGAQGQVLWPPPQLAGEPRAWEMIPEHRQCKQDLAVLIHGTPSSKFCPCSWKLYILQICSKWRIYSCQICNTVQYIGRNTMCHVTAVLTIKRTGDLVDFSSLTVSLDAKLTIQSSNNHKYH